MFGNLFNRRPSGSPLDPRLASAPVSPVEAPKPLMAPPAPILAQTSPANPLAVPVAPTLPTPPASIQRKKLNMWDKEHISGTLAEISRGFASSDDFFGGLSGAATNVASAAEGFRKAEKGTSEIGGPDNAFEITTGPNGERTFKPIAEVTDYMTAKRKRETAPKPKETAELIGDSLYAVEQLDEAQRPGAYQLLLKQAAEAGHDLSGIPPEYSPTFAKAMIARTIGARQGSANAATAQYRSEVNADRDEARRASVGFRAAADARARAAAGRAASKASAPPSTRKGRKTSDLDYLK